MSQSLPLEAAMVLSEYDWNMALTTRYLCLAGLVLLVHDHITSLGMERRLVWTAPRSLAKYAFLLNRYLVLTALVLAFVGMSGFAGIALSQEVCWKIWVVEGSLLIVSFAIGNGVVTSQIINLWDGRKAIQLLVWTGYVIAYATSLATYGVGSRTQKANVAWIPFGLNTCAPLRISPFYIIAWAVPLTYEMLLLVALVWNAMDRPRQENVSLARSLRRDGIMFMLVMASLRAVQLGMVASLQPANFLLLQFIIWTVITMTLNRSILAMREEETKIEPSWVVPEPPRDALSLDMFARLPSRATHRLSRKARDSPIHVEQSFLEC